MKDIQSIAQSFSGGKFEEVEEFVAESITWTIYEEKMVITGKQQVMNFGRQVAEYFKTLTTKFEMFGLVADEAKVAIYGKAEFIRDGQTVNTVHSCDVYEFDAEGKIQTVYSYCNSNPIAKQD